MSSTEQATPSFVTDPYPTLARLRAASPVSILNSEGGVPLWLIPRYRDVRAALVDRRFGQDVRRAQRLADSRVAGLELGTDVVHMLNSDPPDHTRLRGLIQGAFTPRRQAAMRPTVERIATGILDDLADRDTVDLVHDFAFPLPIGIICELLGFPTEDRYVYREWSTAILTHGSDGDFARAMAEMTAYLTEQLDRRRVEPGEDMLTDLLHASEADRLTVTEVVSMVFLLLIGGHETTVNLISTAALALLRNPDQAAWLRANPAEMPTAVEEFLRFDSPVRMATLRFTTEEVDVDGVRIPPDELVLLSLGSANRDPERFPEPDRLILNRGDAGHLAFGHGIHRCLGSFLGKLEAEVAMTGLLTRFPKLALAADERELTWRNTIMLRGLETLRAALHG
ncbi:MULTISPECIES: cytochrome P450 family protein [Actinoalloteichus]|uniref:Cytochrome P450 n=1 Tax=Actinoalloteichus fjordicus TaxID=1612552 RepID=A0AAC9PTB2_9PSEU|nr:MULTISPECIES: cytochrome P450 [Actinoalloteichus]APU15953.1 cytochrome P450 [Actinoalloteichus fjordicus]APU22016.1 cytochrome P450 [Actinoalloteichus sp. GBA129-24]